MKKRVRLVDGVITFVTDEDTKNKPVLSSSSSSSVSEENKNSGSSTTMTLTRPGRKRKREEDDPLPPPSSPAPSPPLSSKGKEPTTSTVVFSGKGYSLVPVETKTKKEDLVDPTVACPQCTLINDRFLTNCAACNSVLSLQSSQQNVTKKEKMQTRVDDVIAPSLPPPVLRSERESWLSQLEKRKVAKG
jgi:hypothetical protein